MIMRLRGWLAALVVVQAATDGAFKSSNRNRWTVPLSALRGGADEASGAGRLSSTSQTTSGQLRLGVRDSVMIAHSFSGAEFGPAQQLHGATYTVDVEWVADELCAGPNWVIDIGVASGILSEVLALYNFKNLDEVFPGENTTTEWMCMQIHREIAGRVRGKFHGSLRVKLRESHKAWASFEGGV